MSSSFCNNTCGSFVFVVLGCIQHSFGLSSCDREAAQQFGGEKTAASSLVSRTCVLFFVSDLQKVLRFLDFVSLSILNVKSKRLGQDL